MSMTHKTVFASFYQIYNGSVTEACGSDAHFILDARLNLSNMGLIASSICKQRSYAGYTVSKGTFSSNKQVKRLTMLTNYY
jgi:hypothetical protein